MEWSVYDESDGIQTLRTTEIKIQILLSCGLHQIWNTHVLQTLTGKSLIAFMTGEEHHLSHSFAKLIDVVHQHFQVDGTGFRASSLVGGGSGLGLLHGQFFLLEIRRNLCYPGINTPVSHIILVHVIQGQTYELAVNHRC